MKCVNIGKCLNVFFCFTSYAVTAQLYEHKFPLEFGIHAGPNIYQGDLTPSAFGSYKTIDFTAGLHVNVIINRAFSIRANYNYGRLRGDDGEYNDKPWRQQRNYRFNATLHEYSAVLVWDIFAQNNEITTAYAPYIFAGVGHASVSIQRDFSRFNPQYFAGQPSVIAGLNADLTNPLPKHIRILPIGIGIRHPLSPVLSVKAESSLRFSSSDYLDGFSNAADTKQNDHYYSLAIGLIFSPGKKTKDREIPCPELK